MKLGPKSKRNELFPLKSKQNESFQLKTPSESKGGLKRTPPPPLKTRVVFTLYITIQAMSFKQWVTKNALLSIRKTGMIEIGSQIQMERIVLAENG